MSADNPPLPGYDGSAARRRAGLVLLALLLGYAALVYYGFGPYPTRADAPWWHPRGFLTDSSLMAPFGADPMVPVATFAAPALLLALGAAWTLRSAVLRTVALAAALATGLFLFYGLRFPGPDVWRFFGWRGSAVMILMALLVAATLLSPLLAAAWLRRGWGVRLAVYLPVLLAVAVTSASMTGTDPELAFNVSPWPVLTVFGYEGLATLLVGALACLALALGAMRQGAAAGGAGAVAALVVPFSWAGLDLPFGLPLLAAAVGLALAALALATSAAGNLTMGLRSLAGYTAVGVLLAAIPLGAGHAWARMDYSATRDERAQRIIDALAAYYEREGLYPEDLAELVDAGDLDRVPQPRIGLALGNGQSFTYQNFGTDYLLEFAAPGWTQCAYSPPWEDDWANDGYADPLAPVARDDAGGGTRVAQVPADDDAADAAPEAATEGLGPEAAGLPEADYEAEAGGLGPAAAGLPEADYEAEVGGVGPAAAGLPGADEDVALDALDSVGPEAAGLPGADEEIPVGGEDLPGAWTCPTRPPDLW